MFGARTASRRGSGCPGHRAHGRGGGCGGLSFALCRRCHFPFRSRVTHQTATGIHAVGSADHVGPAADLERIRSEEPTSELQSQMGISISVFCLKKKKKLE